MKKNIPLLRRLRTRFLRMKHKKHFRMQGIAVQTDCGASMCFIGHVLDLCGYGMKPMPQGAFDRYSWVQYDFFRPSGVKLRKDLQEEARKLLGLDWQTANDFFQDYSVRTPKQAAKRIEKLIAEG